MTKKEEAIEALDDMFDEVHGTIAKNLKEIVLEAFEEIEIKVLNGDHPRCKQCSASSPSEEHPGEFLYCSRLHSGDYAVSDCRVDPDFFCQKFSFK